MNRQIHQLLGRPFYEAIFKNNKHDDLKVLEQNLGSVGNIHDIHQPNLKPFQTVIILNKDIDTLIKQCDKMDKDLKREELKVQIHNYIDLSIKYYIEWLNSEKNDLKLE